jgi:hypothetical protein
LLTEFVKIASGKTEGDMRAALIWAHSSVSACFGGSFPFPMSLSACTTVDFAAQ